MSLFYTISFNCGSYPSCLAIICYFLSRLWIMIQFNCRVYLPIWTQWILTEWSWGCHHVRGKFPGRGQSWHPECPGGGKCDRSRRTKSSGRRCPWSTTHRSSPSLMDWRNGRPHHRSSPYRDPTCSCFRYWLFHSYHPSYSNTGQPRPLEYNFDILKREDNSNNINFIFVRPLYL